VFCQKEHQLTETDHFPRNKAIEGLIQAEINKLDLGEDYEEACRLVDDLNAQKAIYEKMRSKPEEFVFEKFQEMRRKADLIREDIIQKAQECSEKIISDINEYENECKLRLASLDSKPQSNEPVGYSQIKDDLQNWKVKSKRLFCDEEFCNEVYEKLDEYSLKLSNGVKELKNELLLGKQKRFEFENKYLNILDVFYNSLGFNT
jgi:hypothetical protein